jgi:hypothetical protein
LHLACGTHRIFRHFFQGQLVKVVFSPCLRSSFTRQSGEHSVNYYFPVGNHVGILYLDIEDVDSLVVDEKIGPASPARSAPRPLETGRRYELAIQVSLLGENATLEVELDGQPHLQWTGVRSRLPETTTSGRFALGSRDGDTIFHELRLRLSDDPANPTER